MCELIEPADLTMPAAANGEYFFRVGIALAHLTSTFWERARGIGRVLPFAHALLA